MGDPGRLFPEDYWGTGSEDGADWSNPATFLANCFENTCAVQFHHRVLALSTLAASSSLFFIHGLAAKGGLPGPSRGLVALLCAAAWCQVGLGVATLLNHVPVHLGSAHQAGALTLMSITLATVYVTRPAGATRLARRAAQVMERKPTTP